MLEKFDGVEFSNDDIDLDYLGSDIVTFFTDGMSLSTIDLNNFNLHYANLDEYNRETIIHVRFTA